ncbi:hypothetical protein GCM10007147_33050 [Nocardiopsis kunsanensis]|uniref:Uncharacterized protein n=1 Tax=Nocardiopsis kunsanensis TaxID=141693 RepID=A0A919CJL3_9ACTN|nr:hypothetical protein GCM10007147_33050 [Nocardiopsis kunsanensis]
MLNHIKGSASAQVHGAGSPLPHGGQVRSATVLARCVAPWPKVPLRVPRGGLTRHVHAVSGRLEPTSHMGTEAREPALDFGLDRGKAPCPKETEETETGPRPRGCPPSTTRAARPQSTCTVQDLPRSRLFFFFQGVFVVAVCGPVPRSWGRALSVAGVHIP